MFIRHGKAAPRKIGYIARRLHICHAVGMLVFAVLVVASFFASAILFRHTRFTTWIAAAGLLLEGQWLLLTLLQRTSLAMLPLETFYLGGAAVLLAGWLVMVRQARWPRISRTTLQSDLLVLVTCAIIFAGLYLVLYHNGYTNGQYVMHGFYNGDTATFTALTERSLQERGLVEENPFSGNGPLEYPTLVHAGWANFFSLVGVGNNWLQLLEPFTVLILLLTVPAFFLLWDTIVPEPTEPWRQWLGVPSRGVLRVLQVGIVLYIAALSWDSYIYPQSHFFLTGLFLLLAALVVRAGAERGMAQLRFVLPAVVLALTLLFANAVTGTAAVGVLAVLHLFRANDRSRPVVERVLFLGTVILWLGAIVVVSPGEASWGLPGFSYTAALDMLKLAPVLLLLLVALLMQLERHRLLIGMCTALVAMALVTFFFSQRNIVIDNASRFFYHALLVGFPLLIIPMIRGYYWLRRELFLSTQTLFEKTAGLAAVGAGILLFLLPAGASVASSMDALLFKNEITVSSEELAALEWVQATPTDTVFAANPDGPWTIPIFTGRALLRTNYWLSAEDPAQTEVSAAFAGDQAAQQEVIEQVEYVYLHRNEQSAWQIPTAPVFENSEIAIYQSPF